MRELYEGLGAFVVDGGETFNPSIYDLLAAIHEVPAEEVLVLPNNPNVVMAAERAAELSDKRGPGRRLHLAAGGLAALVELDPARVAEENAERLGEALDGVRVGSVAPAARDDSQGRFVRGDAVGFVGDEIVAWGGAGSTLAETIERLAEGAEIVTDHRAARARRSRSTSSRRMRPGGGGAGGPRRRAAALLVAAGGAVRVDGASCRCSGISAVSHYTEKARWALDWKGVEAEFRRRRRARTWRELMVLTRGATHLPGAGARRPAGSSTRPRSSPPWSSAPDPPLYPADPAERARALELEDFFDERASVTTCGGVGFWEQQDRDGLWPGVAHRRPGPERRAS